METKPHRTYKGYFHLSSLLTHNLILEEFLSENYKTLKV